MSKFMKQNEGMSDRGIRVIAGLCLLATTVVGPETPWGLIGIVPLLTGLAGSCPIYSLLGLSTCSTKRTTDIL